MIAILIALLIFAVVAVLAFYVVGQMGLQPPIDMIVRIIIGAILLIALLSYFAPHLHAADDTSRAHVTQWAQHQPASSDKGDVRRVRDAMHRILHLIGIG